ncbi:hypothetical protein THAOC_26925, partial [Thalassiosira oceanica]
KRGMGDTCPFCRTPTPDGDAATLALVQKRVDARDPDATTYLASAYYYGNKGLQRDIPRAIELWSEAASLGDLDANFMLGCRYCDGEGVEQNVARSAQHWQHAAIQGHPESRYLLGVHEYDNGNHQLAVRHWMISAKLGCEISLKKIKDMFMKGHATKAQYAEALRGYQNALEETKSPQREETNARRHVIMASRRALVSQSHELIAALRKRPDLDCAETACPARLTARSAQRHRCPSSSSTHCPPRAWNGAPHRTSCPALREDGAAAKSQSGEGEPPPADSTVHGGGLRLASHTRPIPVISIARFWIASSLRELFQRHIAIASSKNNPCALLSQEAYFESRPVSNLHFHFISRWREGQKGLHLLKQESEVLGKENRRDGSIFWQLSFVFLCGSVHCAPRESLVVQFRRISLSVQTGPLRKGNVQGKRGAGCARSATFASRVHWRPTSTRYRGGTGESTEITVLIPKYGRHLQYYGRFIDDATGAWNDLDDPEAFDRFCEDVNDFGILRWEVEERCNQIDFLDLTIWINKENRIMTKTFRKPQNIYQYIPKQSAHPQGLAVQSYLVA